MKNGFFEKHPCVTAVYFLSVIVLSMLFLHPLFLALSFCGALAEAIRVRGKSAFKSLFTFLIPLFVFVAAVNTVFADYGETALFSVFGKNISMESAAYGAATGSSAITLILWLMIFSGSITEEKMMFFFRGKMPSVSVLVMTVLRFIPLYSRRFSESYSARKGMGLSKGTKRSDEMKNAAACVSGVIGFSLESSIETADSMKARGYGIGKRTDCSRFVFTATDGVLLAAEIILTAAVAVLKAAGMAYASYNPRIEIGEASPVATAAFALLCFLPLITDFAESVKWNILYAKI